MHTRYSPVRHFTRPANRAFSCDLHVLGMPPALILSQDQTLQFYLEFSRTRTHYLVFKEQTLVISIVAISRPLSRGFVSVPLACPLSGNCFCNPIRPPCQPLGADYFPPRRAYPAAFQATVIYIQSPLPCQAPFSTFHPFLKGGLGGILPATPGAGPRDPSFLLLPPP